ncbi:hypothetical protein F4859DRAFT_519847 [Xylaria cf. heliscus]|nr:hypothetical protein F4859DRAFT_519847 [Xylaria cf. heliscus]
MLTYQIRITQLASTVAEKSLAYPSFEADGPVDLGLPPYPQPTRYNSDSLTDEDMVDEYEIMLWYSRFIRKSADGKNLGFSQFTVQEFLKGIDPTHSTLRLYRVSENRAHNAVAQMYIRY